MMGKSPKKPITKRKWFWPVVGVVAISAIAGGGGDKEDQKQTPVDLEKSVVQVDTSDRSTLTDVSRPEENISSQTTIPEPDISTDESEPKKPDPEPVTPKEPEQPLDPTPAQTPSQEPKPETPDPGSDPKPIINQQPEPEPKPEKTIKGKSSDTIVYVSRRSNTIHSVNDCGGMKNYREMTLGEANNRGCEYCPNCW